MSSCTWRSLRANSTSKRHRIGCPANAKNVGGAQRAVCVEAVTITDHTSNKLNASVAQPFGDAGRRLGRRRSRLRWDAMQELEFTIEPFVEGQPGPHVLAAIAAVEAAGWSVEFGPFGSSCRADPDAMPGIVAAIVSEAFAHGATHVSLHVAGVAAAQVQDG